MLHRLLAVVALTVIVTACSSSEGPAIAPELGDAGRATASTRVETPAAEPVDAPQGFERVGATITKADGEVCEICLWRADTPELRSRGLMFVTGLGDADGMVFAYPEPRTGTFWMKNTILPLSIAYFDADGRYLDEHDMAPCTTPSCIRYPTSAGMQFAIETTQGDLPALGIEPGSTLTLTTLPCERSSQV